MAFLLDADSSTPPPSSPSCVPPTPLPPPVLELLNSRALPSGFLPVYDLRRAAAMIPGSWWLGAPHRSGTGLIGCANTNGGDGQADKPVVILPDAPPAYYHRRVSGAPEEHLLLLGSRRETAPPPSVIVQSPKPVRHTLATRIHDYYRAKGDLERTVHLADRSKTKPSKFNTPVLKGFRLFALSTGGTGLSNKGRREYWATTVAAEKATAGNSGRVGPMTAAFPTASSFVRALRGEQDRCMAELGWRKTDILLGGTVFVFYSRDLWKVAVEAMLSGIRVVLHGERRWHENGEAVRSETLNGDLFLNEQEDVRRLHQTLFTNVFVLAIQLYSDAALVSWSGGKKQPWSTAARDRSVARELHHPNLFHLRSNAA